MLFSVHLFQEHTCPRCGRWDGDSINRLRPEVTQVAVPAWRTARSSLQMPDHGRPGFPRPEARPLMDTATNRHQFLPTHSWVHSRSISGAEPRVLARGKGQPVLCAPAVWLSFCHLCRGNLAAPPRMSLSARLQVFLICCSTRGTGRKLRQLLPGQRPQRGQCGPDSEGVSIRKRRQKAPPTSLPRTAATWLSVLRILAPFDPPPHPRRRAGPTLMSQTQKLRPGGASTPTGPRGSQAARTTRVWQQAPSTA